MKVFKVIPDSMITCERPVYVKSENLDGIYNTGAINWVLGEWYEASGEGDPGLHGSDWMCAYPTAEIAAACYHNALLTTRDVKLFEAEMEDVLDVEKQSSSVMVHGKRLKLIKEVPFPEMSMQKKIAFVKALALSLYPLTRKHDSGGDWLKWANGGYICPAKAIAAISEGLSKYWDADGLSTQEIAESGALSLAEEAVIVISSGISDKELGSIMYNYSFTARRAMGIKYPETFDIKDELRNIANLLS